MSTLSLALFQSHLRPQSELVPVQASDRFARQLDLPLEGLRRLRVIVGGLFRRPRVERARVIYFGTRKQFVAVGTTIRRVEAR